MLKIVKYKHMPLITITIKHYIEIIYNIVQENELIIERWKTKAVCQWDVIVYLGNQRQKQNNF